MKMKTVLGSELQVGDTIEVGWKPGRDTIISLTPYLGSLQELAEARIAEFALNRVGMTIEPLLPFNLVYRKGEKP